MSLRRCRVPPRLNRYHVALVFQLGINRLSMIMKVFNDRIDDFSFCDSFPWCVLKPKVKTKYRISSNRSPGELQNTEAPENCSASNQGRRLLTFGPVFARHVIQEEKRMTRRLFNCDDVTNSGPSDLESMSVSESICFEKVMCTTWYVGKQWQSMTESYVLLP